MNEPNRFEPPKSAVADIEPAAQIPEAPNEAWHSRYWNGRAPLWKAFWLVGILGQFATVLGTAVISTFVLALLLSPLANYALSMVAVAGIAVFASVSVWRCAVNARHPQLGALARVAVAFYGGSWLLWILKFNSMGSGA